jgi:V/A-type H+-transporting ATPase subunit E
VALDGILTAIRREADAEIDEIRRRGEAERRDLLARAHAEAAVLEEEAACARDERAVRRRDRIVNRAKLMADRELRAAGEAVYQDAVSGAERRLAAFRGTPRYSELMTGLLEESLAVLPDARVLEVDERDTDLLGTLLERRRLHQLEIAPSLHTAGGLAVVTGDGRRVDNTFESRVRRSERYLRQIAAASIPLLRERAQ